MDSVRALRIRKGESGSSRFCPEQSMARISSGLTETHPIMGSGCLLGNFDPWPASESGRSNFAAGVQSESGSMIRYRRTTLACACGALLD